MDWPTFTEGSSEGESQTDDVHTSALQTDEEESTTSPATDIGSSPSLERQMSVDSGIPLSPRPDTPENHPTHDLPTPLLEKGWRKIWSRRENRPYYFNKFSRESLWDQPSLEVSLDVCCLCILFLCSLAKKIGCILLYSALATCSLWNVNWVFWAFRMPFICLGKAF